MSKNKKDRIEKLQDKVCKVQTKTSIIIDLAIDVLDELKKLKKELKKEKTK